MSTAAVIVQVDELHKVEKHHDNFGLLQAEFDKGNRDPEILWRLARTHYLLGEETEDKTARQPHVETGLQLINQAVEADPNNFASHKWKGILISAMGQFISTNEKISNAYIIRDEFLKSIELNPNDATTQHCMGKWCWSILQIGWLERQAASLLFGTPPTSTYEECEKYLLASEKLDATQTNNKLLLGDLYYQQKNWAEAKKWYESCAATEALSDRARREVEEAKKKAAKC
jgi:hypothetical protein